MGQRREAVDVQCYGPTLSGGDAPQAVRGLCVWSLFSHPQNDSTTYNYPVNPAGQTAYLDVSGSSLYLSIVISGPSSFG